MLLWIGPTRLVLVRDARREGAPLWQLPGGNVEQGETFAEAAVHECKEETGLTITRDQLLFRYGSRSETGPRKMVVVFDVLLPKGTVVPEYGAVTGEKTGIFDRAEFMDESVMFPEHIRILEGARFSEFPRPIHFLRPHA